jgi:hypothetical protein
MHFRELSKLSPDTISGDLLDFKALLIEIFQSTKFQEKFLRNQALLDNVFDYLELRASTAKSDNDIFQSRIVPSVIYQSAITDRDNFQLQFKNQLIAPIMGDLTPLQILQEQFVDELRNFIDSLPFSCEKSYMYPPNGRIRDYVIAMLRKYIMSESNESSLSNMASYVRVGVSIASNFPILIRGNLYKCHVDYLPLEVKEDPNTYRLSEFIFLQAIDPYLQITKVPKSKKHLATLSFSDKNTRSVGIAMTTRFLIGGIELCFEKDVKKQTWRDPPNTVVNYDDVSLTKFVNKLQTAKKCNKVIYENKRPTRSPVAPKVFEVNSYLK